MFHFFPLLLSNRIRESWRTQTERRFDLSQRFVLIDSCTSLNSKEQIETALSPALPWSRGWDHFPAGGESSFFLWTEARSLSASGCI